MEEILTISPYFSLLFKSTLLLGLLFVVFGVNLEAMFCLNVLLRSSAFSESYPAS